MKKYARFNIQLLDGLVGEASATQWLSYLHAAALDGHAKDFEIFYTETRHVVGVSVPYSDEDLNELLDAGTVLGFCLARYACSPLPNAGTTWLSIHDIDDQTLYSSL